MAKSRGGNIKEESRTISNKRIKWCNFDFFSFWISELQRYIVAELQSGTHSEIKNQKITILYSLFDICITPSSRFYPDCGIGWLRWDVGRKYFLIFPYQNDNNVLVLLYIIVPHQWWRHDSVNLKLWHLQVPIRPQKVHHSHQNKKYKE